MLLDAAVHDPFDGPEWATVIGQVVTAIGIIVVGWWANRARKDARVVRDQVENEHRESDTPNLRDDMDAKAKAAEQRDREQRKRAERIEKKLDEMGIDMRLLRAGYFANREDIDDLLDTQGNRRKANELEHWGPPPVSRRERRERGYG